MFRRLAALLPVAGTMLMLSVTAPLAEGGQPDPAQIARDLSLVDILTWGVTPTDMAVFQAAGKKKMVAEPIASIAGHAPAGARAIADRRTADGQQIRP
jgi:hypothetical protein